MAEVRPKYSKEDAVRKGQEIFDSDVLPNLVNEAPSHFVAIDIETGDYEVGDDELTIIDRLRARQPEAQVWTRRVGSEFAHRIGRRTWELAE